MAQYVLPVATVPDDFANRTVVSDANPLPVTAVAGGTSSSKAEDGAHTSGDTGTLCLAVRRDTAAVGSDTDGDYSSLNVDGSGRLWTAVGAISAGETHVGQVGTGGRIVNITPTVDTSAYTAADVLFDSTEIANAVRVSGGRSELVSLFFLDEDDNTAATITLFFFRSNVSLGTINNAISITDANARELIGMVKIAASEYADCINSQFACKVNVGLLLAPTTGTSIWVAAATAGTPTQTAGGIKMGFSFRYH